MRVVFDLEKEEVSVRLIKIWNNEIFLFFDNIVGIVDKVFVLCKKKILLNE
jgi:hypothetical protein